MDTTSLERRRYVDSVLDLYRRAPTVSGYARRADRRLANDLHDRGVPLATVRAALVLAVARRAFRSPSAPPLAPIATLHYVRPVIEELLANPPDPDYIAYVQHKLAAVAPDFVMAADHQLP